MLRTLFGISTPYSPSRYANANSLWDYKADLLGGRTLALSQYAGKVVLVVNTASHCGLTPQYEALQKLQLRYENQGFMVLAFPSSDFKNQEFATEDEIADFCNLKFSITFPLFGKAHVKKGPAQHPVWKFLTSKELNGFSSLGPKWNFQKYLVNRKGELVEVFLPQVSPLAPRLRKRIEAFLALSA